MSGRILAYALGLLAFAGPVRAAGDTDEAKELVVELCLLLIPSAAEILGFSTNVSQCEQSARVRQTLARSPRR